MYYDDGDDENLQDSDLADEVSAMRYVLEILLSTLKRKDKPLYKDMHDSALECADSLRRTLGEVDEEHIVAHAHHVADIIEGFFASEVFEFKKNKNQFTLSKKELFD